MLMAPDNIMKSIAEKIGSGITVALSLLLISWGIWVTTSIYGLNVTVETGKQLRMSQYQNLCSDVEDMKRGFETQRKEINELKALLAKNNEQILEKLGEIRGAMKR